MRSSCFGLLLLLSVMHKSLLAELPDPCSSPLVVANASNGLFVLSNCIVANVTMIDPVNVTVIIINASQIFVDIRGRVASNVTLSFHSCSIAVTNGENVSLRVRALDLVTWTNVSISLIDVNVSMPPPAVPSTLFDLRSVGGIIAGFNFSIVRSNFTCENRSLLYVGSSSSTRIEGGTFVIASSSLSLGGVAAPAIVMDCQQAHLRDVRFIVSDCDIISGEFVHVLGNDSFGLDMSLTGSRFTMTNPSTTIAGDYFWYNSVIYFALVQLAAIGNRSAYLVERSQFVNASFLFLLSPRGLASMHESSIVLKDVVGSVAVPMVTTYIFMVLIEPLLLNVVLLVQGCTLAYNRTVSARSPRINNSSFTFENSLFDGGYCIFVVDGGIYAGVVEFASTQVSIVITNVTGEKFVEFYAPLSVSYLTVVMTNVTGEKFVEFGASVSLSYLTIGMTNVTGERFVEFVASGSLSNLSILAHSCTLRRRSMNLTLAMSLSNVTNLSSLSVELVGCIVDSVRPLAILHRRLYGAVFYCGLSTGDEYTHTNQRYCRDLLNSCRQCLLSHSCRIAESQRTFDD